MTADGKSHAPMRKTHRVMARPPFERIALVLQGGGALGAYQAGVYQALAEANLHPDWVAGISIGAINAALIIRFSVGSVNVKTGNFVHFDNGTHDICSEHIIASGSLPPGFPATEIQGEHYWDGGLVSNTPLQWVLSAKPRQDTLVFQIDLWNARGRLPRTLIEAEVRQKEIRFSSRTRAATDEFKKSQLLRRATHHLLQRLPDELRQMPEANLLASEADEKVYNIINLIYHSHNYEGSSKDYEFSRRTMEEHWQSGYNEAVRTLRHEEVLQRPQNHDGVFTFDLARDGRE
jgi:NTE family protein